MSKRYKRKKNKKFNTIIIIFCLLIVSIAISVGYSIWSNSIFIEGNVELQYIEQDLPIKIVIQPKTNRYTYNSSLSVPPESGSIGRNIPFAEFSVEQYNLKNKLSVQFKPIISVSKLVSLTVYFDFSNITDFELTDGEAILTRQANLYSPTHTLPKSIVKQGSGTFSSTFEFYPSSLGISTGYLNYKINYKIDGVPYVFYFDIYLSSYDLS